MSILIESQPAVKELKLGRHATGYYKGKTLCGEGERSVLSMVGGEDTSGTINAMMSFLHKFNRRWFFRLLYWRTPPWDSGIAPPELVEFLDSHPPGRSLDLGCGTGTNVLAMARYGWEAAGIDFVPRAIREARRKAKREGLSAQFEVGDVADSANFHGPYDLILDMGCYHALNQDQRRQYRLSVAAHLASGGTFMLYGFLSEDDSRISPEDMAAFGQMLALNKRVDSLDSSGGIASAWFWFGHKAAE